MSSKIEIPKLLAWRLAGLDPHYTTAQLDADEEELQKILAAPVVERQPAAEVSELGALRRLTEDSCNELVSRCLEHADKAAELQATIARLTAENERLKGGQGEPVLWFRPLIGAECNPNGQTYSVIFCEVPGHTPLYASPSAPVQVVLPDYLPLPKHSDYPGRPATYAADHDKAVAHNTAIDKVKELNQ